MQLAATSNSNPTLTAVAIYLDDVNRTSHQALRLTEPSQVQAFAVTAIEQATEATGLLSWASRESEGREGFTYLNGMIENGVVLPLTAARNAAAAGDVKAALDGFVAAINRIDEINDRL